MGKLDRVARGRIGDLVQTPRNAFEYLKQSALGPGEDYGAAELVAADNALAEIGRQQRNLVGQSPR